MRIALIGNMNNNHFALMRHLRDLGADAHLFLYSNEHEHFMPWCDTTNWNRWRPFVHELGISNGGRDAFCRPLKKIESRLRQFDAFLGNGIAPVLFLRMKMTLDLFVPYAEGCEFVVEHEWKWPKPLASAYTFLRKSAMERALKSSVSHVITANAHDQSQATFRRLGIHPVDMFIPMIYRDKGSSDHPLSNDLSRTAARMDAASLTVFSHVSHFWKTLPVAHFLAGVGKRNQWLIQGFAKHVAETGNDRALLVMVKYGPDVSASEALIETLGIEDQVIWLPLMTRVEIMELLTYANIGGSEFAGMLWGGAGWEFLACGVPMLHFLEEPQEYERDDRPLPPFFNVDGPDAIARILTDFAPTGMARLGQAGRDWYDRHQGQALAGQYLAMLEAAATQRKERTAA